MPEYTISRIPSRFKSPTAADGDNAISSRCTSEGSAGPAEKVPSPAPNITVPPSSTSFLPSPLKSPVTNVEPPMAAMAELTPALNVPSPLPGSAVTKFPVDLSGVAELLAVEDDIRLAVAVHVVECEQDRAGRIRVRRLAERAVAVIEEDSKAGLSRDRVGDVGCHDVVESIAIHVGGQVGNARMFPRGKRYRRCSVRRWSPLFAPPKRR